MYDKDLEDEVREQEILLFGGCVENPKYSFGEGGASFSPSRYTRETPSNHKSRKINNGTLFEIEFNFQSGECKHVPKSILNERPY